MKLPWKYILVSLALGFLIGASVGLLCSQEFRHRWMKHSPDIILQRLDRDLKLSETQRAQILPILTAEHEKAMTFREQVRQSAQAQIRIFLTPDQQARFDAMVARFEAKQKKWDRR